MARTIRVAHSPDPDDAFMAWALHQGAADDERLRFEVETADIASLNRAALDGRYDVSAVSAASLPAIADRYVVLDHGGSFGEGYGPVVVALRQPPDPAAARVAIPGRTTTAFLLLELAWGPVDAVEVPFERIGDVVRAGSADFGLLIHEGQITYAREGFRPALDLGRWWETATGMPLPLGVVVARRDLGDDLPEVSRRIRAATESALANRGPALEFAKKFGRGIGDEDADRFVGMYVTGLTRSMGERGRAAIRELLARASAAGLAPACTVTFHA